MTWRTMGLWPAAGFAVLLCSVIVAMGVYGGAPERVAAQSVQPEPSAGPAPRLADPEGWHETAERTLHGVPTPPNERAASELATPELDDPPLDLDPMDLVSDIIDSMTTDELLDLLSNVTRREREELEEELEDPKAFARALAMAILSGWATEEPAVEGALSIRFDTRLGKLEGDEPGREIFPSSTTRIFGTFPLGPGEDVTVLAKWYRVNPPEFLLLEEVRVLERDGQGFIRLDRREGWAEGLYRLELYESSQAVEPLAKGAYRTVGNQGPLLATFH